MTVRYCSACGSSVESGDAFCSQCGQQVADRQQTGRGDTASGWDDTVGGWSDAVGRWSDAVWGDATSGWGGTGRSGSDRGRTGGGRGRTGRERGRTDGQRGRSNGQRGRANTGQTTGGGTPTGRQRLAARIDRLRGSGWRVQQDDGDRVVMVDRDVGSVPAHVLLFLVTGGTGNVLYGAYRWTIGAPRRELGIDGTDRQIGGNRSLEAIGLGVLAGIVLFLGLIVSFASLLVGEPTGVTALVTALGVSYLLARLAGLGGDGLDISRFGRERTVDTEPAQVAAEPCASCGGPVQSGERRQYTDRTYVAGLSVWTHRSGENVYCQQCLSEEQATDHAATGFDMESERT